MEKWLPVDAYIGGMEHAILHLLYARFIHKFLFKLGAFKHPFEPFKQLITQGLVKGQTFKLKENGKYLKGEEVKQYKEEEYEVNSYFFVKMVIEDVRLHLKKCRRVRGMESTRLK